MNIDKSNIEKVKDSYDSVAGIYVDKCFYELDYKPFDRNILERFSQMTKSMGKVCDMGCGPGEIAAYLKKCGSDVMGIDISDEMIIQASKLTPGVSFIQDNMFSLSLDSNSLAGIAAFYAIVNYEIDSLDKAFLEFYRVIVNSGYLLIAFHIGDNKLFEVKGFLNSQKNLDFCYFNIDDILLKLQNTGFVIEEAIIRYPYEQEYPTKRAYIIAKKSL